MILEGIVTTLNADGTANVAPMGPRVPPDFRRLLFRPFRTAQTYQNLLRHREGVFHVTDDVLLLARAALGDLPEPPPVRPARHVRGFALSDACRVFEFRVRSVDDREERSRVDAEVVHAETLRDFFGFNRAKHAVVEAAILATRTDFLPLEEIEAEFRKFAVVIGKTGGEQEHAAFAFLQQHLARVAGGRRG